jgi:hypothetical protein
MRAQFGEDVDPSGNTLAWMAGNRARADGFSWWARLATAGSLLCLALIALLHVLEPEFNDSNATSEYALGDFGWLMNIAFFSGAAGIGALAFALRRSLARSKTAIAGIVLLSLAAVAYLFLGAGNIDPQGAEETTSGLIHGIGFLLGLPTRLAAPLVLAFAFRRDANWEHHRRLSLALGITALVAEVAGFIDLASVVTLRLALALWLVWIALTGARALAISAR